MAARAGAAGLGGAAFGDDDTSTETGSEPSDASGSEAASWIAWFTSLRGNEYFCAVDEDYIQDDFNLAGLSAQVPYYDYALDLILDADSPAADALTDAQQELVESAAEALYGLIHARFVLTGRGLAAVADRFRSSAFGRCPRLGCGGQAVLPLGPSDVPRQATVAVWCPRCEDAFRPPVKGAAALDGAYFTTTLPHLLLLTYPALRPPAPHPDDVPSARVFGFRVAERARAREPHGAPVTGWGVTAAAAAGRAAAAASNAPPAAGQRGEGGGAGGGADKAV